MNHILIGGIGNIFMGDDGFGCEVAGQLSQQTIPAAVDVVDFGIRGLDLSYALMDGYDGVILIDAVDRGGAPGSIYRIAPDFDPTESGMTAASEPMIAPHEMDPVKVLRFAASLEGQCPRVLLVACQPKYLGGDEGYMGLSEPVTAAVPIAIAEIRHILTEWSADEHVNTPHKQMSA